MADDTETPNYPSLQGQLITSRTCSVHHMPPEILRAIFEINAIDGDVAAAVYTSHVCRFWRNIALATPKLWTDVCVGLEEAEEFCRRSNPLPIHISNKSNPERSILLGVNAIAKYDTHPSSSIRIIQRNLDNNLPLLSHLELHSSDGLIFGGWALDMPRLTNLKLSSFALPSWEGIGNLTTLHLKNDYRNRTITVTVAELSCMLKASPQLRVLFLRGLYFVYNRPDTHTHFVAQLAHLESLTIHRPFGEEDAVARLMSHISIPSSAPALRTLKNKQILHLTDRSIWVRSTISAPVSILTVSVIVERDFLFLRHFSSAFDLSRIMCLVFDVDGEVEDVILGVDILKVFLNYMPSLRQIDLRTKLTWLEMFLLALWPQSGPFDEFSRHVNCLNIEVVGRDFDAGATSELLIDHLKARLRIVGSPLDKLMVNFTAEGISERMGELVLNFTYNQIDPEDE